MEATLQFSPDGLTWYHLHAKNTIVKTSGSTADYVLPFTVSSRSFTLTARINRYYRRNVHKVLMAAGIPTATRSAGRKRHRKAIKKRGR